MSRQSEITTAVDRLIKAHNEWESDPTSPIQPSRKLELTIEDTLGVCLVGDIPGECRELVAAMDDLSSEWDKFKGGHWKDNGTPRGSFWDAYRRMVDSRSGFSVYAPRRPEPVKTMRAQKVSDLNIAKAWGWRDGNGVWHGPYFGPNGTVASALLDQAEQDEYSVCPKDWIHPAEKQRIKEQERELQTRLERIDRHREDFTPDSATIEELIMQGAYESQIVKVKGCTVEEVRDVARRMGRTVQALPNLAAERGAYDPPLTEADHLAFPSQRRTPGTSDAAEAADGSDRAPAPEAGSVESRELAERIIALATSSETEVLSASDIARRINEESQQQLVTVQKVAGVLRTYKREAAATAG